MTDEDLKSQEPESLPKLIALLRADKSLSPEAIAAKQDNISVAMMRMRLNQCGAIKIAAHSRA